MLLCTSVKLQRILSFFHSKWGFFNNQSQPSLVINRYYLKCLLKGSITKAYVQFSLTRSLVGFKWHKRIKRKADRQLSEAVVAVRSFNKGDPFFNLMWWLKGEVQASGFSYSVSESGLLKVITVNTQLPDIFTIITGTRLIWAGLNF